MTSSFKTLAFFDLETTGLPAYEFFKTKIIELCVVACTTEQLLATRKSQCPRVIHKLSICLNPHKLISPTSSNITGLDNFMLEHDNGLNDNAGQLLTSFLQHLQQPVCLVAHNGDSFDFPLLKKQLKTLSVKLPESLRCVDSLPIFREIDRLQSMALLNHDDDDLLPMPLDEIEQKQISNSTSTLRVPATESVAFSSSPITDEISVKQSDLTFDWQKANETTPSTRVTLKAKAPKVPQGSTTPRTPATPTPLGKATSLFKRKLFDTPEQPNISKKKYTLSDVYERLHGRKPHSAHYAEADTMSLLLCVRTLGDQFIELAERDSRLFSDVKELGVR